MNERSCCSAPSLAPDVVSVLCCGHSNKCLLSYFKLHFPEDCDVEHLFTCLFAICTSSPVRGLFRSFAHFSNKLFIFLLLSFKSSLDIFWITALYQIMSFGNIFPQSLACLLLLHNIFYRTEVFHLDEVQLINYFFHCHAF